MAFESPAPLTRFAPDLVLDWSALSAAHEAVAGSTVRNEYVSIVGPPDAALRAQGAGRLRKRVTALPEQKRQVAKPCDLQ